MADVFVNFNGRIDRRSARSAGKPENPVERQNLLSRDGKNIKMRGTERLNVDSPFTDAPVWMARYTSDEVGLIQPKTFVYTLDGKLWHLNNADGSATELRKDLNPQAYPKSWEFKVGNQTNMYMVDGRTLWKHNGNNQNNWEKVTLEDVDGNSVKPIDVIEHRDRLVVLSEKTIYISANLQPENFTDATDSIEIVLGSGRARNLAMGKIKNFLFFFTTEGIYALRGDTISAVAQTFEVELTEERNIIAGRTLAKVEDALMFLADDLEIWSFNGTESQLMSYNENLKDFINEYENPLKKAVAHYDNVDKYYKLSIVEKGQTINNLEFWWDAITKNIDFIKGRNAACYMQSEPAKERLFRQIGRSDVGYTMWTNRGRNYDEEAIEIRFRSRDITPKKGQNVRFSAFYPEILPSGDRNILFRYLLDGREGEVPDSDSNWSQNLKGYANVLGYIEIRNQTQFTGRAQPKINYSRGQSICFEIWDKTIDMEFDFTGIGIDMIAKGKKKGKKIGK